MAVDPADVLALLPRRPAPPAAATAAAAAPAAATAVAPTSHPPVFVLGVCPRRRERQTARLARAGIPAAWVDAKPADSPEVAAFKGTAPASLGVASCLYNHLLALRGLVDALADDQDWGIVLEDDALPARDWHERLPRALAAAPRDASLVMLAHMTFDVLGLVESVAARGEARTSDRAFAFAPMHGSTWGTQAYAVRRWYARGCLAAITRMDALTFRPSYLTAEMITRNAPRAVLLLHPLAIEESTDTLLGRNVSRHDAYWSLYGRHHYWD